MVSFYFTETSPFPYVSSCCVYITYTGCDFQMKDAGS